MLETEIKVGSDVRLNAVGMSRLSEDREFIDKYGSKIAMIIDEISEQNFYIITYEDGFKIGVTRDEIVKSHEHGAFLNKAVEIGKLVEEKDVAYGNSVDKTYRLMQIFLEKWRNSDDTYTISDSLLKHILLQVRMIDKQNRIFNNPEFDLMGESPYRDMTGYGLQGVVMTDD